MAIVKETKSKKAIQFITDEGHVYGTSKLFLEILLENGGLIKLMRLPFNVSPDRFKKSEIWIPEGADPEEVYKNLGLSPEARNDALDSKVLKDREEKKAYTDAEVW